MADEQKLRDYLKRVTVDLQRTRDRLRVVESRDTEPIAVVAMACRYPGAVHSPEELWRLVDEGTDAIGDFPADRGWDLDRLADPAGEAGSATTSGGFLDDAAGFDAELFGINPREAAAADPQHRLLLELAWELFERAGIPAGAVRGSDTGVFTGVIAQEYGPRLQDGSREYGGYLLTGTTTSVASGRIAYEFGLEGPAVTIDTACSSSLVALHLAARALRAGECGLAVAGGATVLTTPGVFVEFTRQGGLAPDGRCKSFGAGADGTNFAEGGGLLLLERLGDARRHGHPVLAVIRGSAINSDGASNGLTAPNGPSQERVIRHALADARVPADGVDAVDAHGTGTTLGDPIEAQALLATYGRDRPADRPLYLGSVKSNIGHTQAAAGVASVIKMVQAMRHGRLPRTLHAERPSPHVDWAAGTVALLHRPVDWPAADRPRRCAVSSFGISGTNAHLILEQAPAAAEPDGGSGGPAAPDGAGLRLPLVLSAASRAALRAQAGRLHAHLAAHPGLDPADVAYTLATTRTPLRYRAVVHDADGLAALAAGDASPGVLTGEATGAATAFLFTGQGSQRARMGLALAARHPVFAAALREVADHLDPHLDRPLHAILADDGDLIHRTGYAQPALFAFEMAMVRLLDSWGIRPDYVIGHSVGEIAAATVAGVLSLPDACALVAARSRLMQQLSGGGALVAIEATEAELIEQLHGRTGRADVAAVNGPTAVVLSGDDDLVGEVAAAFAARGRRTRRLTVSHAFHSAHMDPMLEPFRQALAGLDFHPPTLPIVTNDTGELARPERIATAGYWVEHVRGTVRFGAGLATLRAAGVERFLEVGPAAVLVALAGEGPGAAAVAVAGRGAEVDALDAAVARMFVHGTAPDWAAFAAGRRVDLPTYPFQHERHWLTPSRTGSAPPGGHPLAPARVDVAAGGDPAAVATGTLSLRELPWLADHVVGERVLLPGTAFAELAAYAGEHLGCGTLDELVLAAPLYLTGAAVELQVSVAAPDEAGLRAVAVHTRPADDGAWTLHASGTVRAGTDPADEPADAWPPPGATPGDPEQLYRRLAARGYRYGPAFRLVEAVWVGDGAVHAEVALPAGTAPDGYGLHPALLDAALHALALLPGEAEGPPRVPFSWSGLRVHATGATRVRATLRPDGDGAVALTLTDPAGAPVATLDRLVLRPLSGAAPAAVRPVTRLDWVAIPPLAAPSLDPSAAPEGDPDGDPGPGPQIEVVRAGGAHDGEPEPAAVRRVWGEVLHRLRAAAAGPGARRLAVCTGGAVAVVPGDTPSPVAAAVWGLARAARAEHPGLVTLIDGPVTDAEAVALARAGEPEVALRDGIAHRPALVSGDDADLLRPPAAGAWRLDITETGTLANLTLAEVSEGPLAPGEVRIAVRAAGLNFRDAMIALGMYPGKADIGSEGAGVVLATGPDVTGLRAGDRVMGLFPGAAATVAVADARTVVPIPTGWTFAQAAAAPIAYLTAYYGLVDLAAARPGESLLVHAAAGGVGMAAVRLARLLGLRVYGTASPGKWPVLRAEGLAEERIASSRTLEFAERFAGAGGGHGIDVVLNALAGEFVDASLGLLAPGGRLLEMGKTDIRDGAPEGRSYRAFDLLEAGPDRIGAMLAQLRARFEDGSLAPLPVTVLDIRRARAALRHLSQARHVGKVVLSVPVPLDPAGTVLVTGATGRVGRALARHLARTHGARRLLLVSRSGAGPGPDDDLARLGVHVTAAACDVADRGALASLLAAIPAEHPLTAVVHAAGVLHDAPLDAQDGAHLDDVAAAKIDGALHLDALTAGADLAAFVLCSSVAGLLGSPGQANYAAANAALDALAARRAAAGRPATALAWGPWTVSTGTAGGGMTAGLSPADRARISRSGLVPLAEPDALDLFDAAIAGPATLAVTARWDRERLATGEPPAILRALAGPAARRRAGSAPAAGASLADRLRASDDPRRDLVELVRGQAAAVLGHSGSDRIEPERAFNAAGFDSLTAVELRNRLGTATGTRLPATLLFDHPTPRQLAEFLHGELLGGAPAAPAPRAGAAGAGPQAGVDDDAIAIIGMACRYPGGVSSPEELWRLVADGVDAVSEFPGNRGWDVGALYDPDPAHPGTTYATRGGFLHDADLFDAAFFGLSPREATATDPQQRLLLETAWEAFERAGIDVGSARGSATGVFVGVINQDYGSPAVHDVSAFEGYLSTGTTTSVASGRIAYTLGLEGPALTVDTACSSSLVALHLAGQALRAGECTLALAGGATVMPTPRTFVEFSRQRGLAPDGRCKAFADAADGTGWGEGAGMLLLERLGDARRHGHRVLAVVKGTAVNSDGASNGLTAPNGPSQQRVIRDALAAAAVAPHGVDAVEAHGTGTTLGDPIEAQALLATYGRDRPADRPLYLGSVKSNIGHTLAAAGVAGVIKMVMALHAGRLPRTLHVDRPSRHVDWDTGAVRLLTEPVDWPGTDRPRRAAVSSFGISGTNAHVVLEQAPPAPPPPAPGGAGPVVWLLSGHDAGGLRSHAAALAAATAGADPHAVARTLAHGRAALPRRAAVVGEDLEALRDGLRALAAGTEHPGVVTGAAAEAAGVVFVFPGQGSQWPAMARALLDTSPVFAERIAACAAAIAEHTDWDLHDVLRGAPGAASLERVDVVQPALFSVMAGLAALWQAHGVRPAAVIGHSQGEIVAAYVAGALSLRDAARIVSLRSRAIADLAAAGEVPAGGMASVAAPEQRVRELLDPAGGLEVAAVNGPASTVVSGPAAAIDRLVAEPPGGLRVRRVPVDYASHSAQMAALRDRLATDLAGIAPRQATVAFHSAVTGGILDGTVLDAEYWYTNLRSTVRFSAAVTSALRAGHRLFAECSPHPVLVTGLQETIEEAADDADGAGGGSAARTAVFGSLRRDEGGLDRFALGLARAWAGGAAVDWTPLIPAAGTRADLPTYPFQRRRFWLEPVAGGRSGDPAALGLDAAGHPLADAVVDSVDGDGDAVQVTAALDPRTRPWLAEHAVAGQVLLAGTAFAELALLGAARAGCPRVEELTVEAPLPLAAGAAVRVRVTVGAAGPDGRRALRVHARPGDEPDGWRRHATGSVAPAAAGTPESLTVWPPPGATPVDLTGAYDRLADLGLEYGPRFRGLVRLWSAGDDLYAQVRLPEPETGAGYAIHPALLDAALHALAVAGDRPDGTVPLPFAWSELVSYHPAGASARVRLRRDGPESCRLLVADDTGRPAASAHLVVRSVDPEQLTGRRARPVHVVDWVERPVGPAGTLRPATVAGPDPYGLATALGLEHTAGLGDLAADEPRTVLVSVPPAEATGPAAVHDAAALALRLVREWSAADRPAGSRLVVVSRSGFGPDAGDPAAAAATGLLRSAQSEMPGALGLIDLELDLGDADAAGAVDAVRAAVAAGAPQVAVRGGRLLVPRLALPAPPPPPEPGLDATGTVLITGGTGTLGRLLARHLLREYRAGHVLLLSRTGPAAPGLAELRAEFGDRVSAAAADVADPSALARLLGEIPPERPLTAVVHAAGVLDDGLTTALDPERLAAVLRPKADGAWHLHHLTRDRPVSFVLFSSLAGIAGSPGQAAYAAANAALDALAVRRRGAGLPAVSLAWGLWAPRSAMTGAADVARTGVVALREEQALGLFDAALAQGGPAVRVPVRFDPAVLRSLAADGLLPPLLSGLVRHTPAPAPVFDLAALAPADRRRALTDLVAGTVAAVLGHRRPEELDPAQRFADLGLDSLTGLELRNRLTARTGVRLPATLVFDHPTVEALAGFLAGALAPAEAADPAGAVLTELETVFGSAGTDDRRALAARLRALLTRWDEPAAGAGADVAARIQVSDTAAIFEFIDSELGRSR